MQPCSFKIFPYRFGNKKPLKNILLAPVDRIRPISKQINEEKLNILKSFY